LVGVGFVWQLRGDPSGARLEAAVAALDADDPSWRLEQIEAAREKVPEAANSARVVTAAAGGLPGHWPPEALRQKLQPLERTPNLGLDPQQSALLHAELLARSAALKDARKLAGMPRGRRPALAANPLATAWMLTASPDARGGHRLTMGVHAMAPLLSD